jgi:hypothetical protein
MSLDKKTCFPLLNYGNYMEWSIHMEAELVRKGLWDNVQCEVSVEEVNSRGGGNSNKVAWKM